eukprot:428802_1
MIISHVTLYLVLFISVTTSVIDYSTCHWWIWIKGAPEKYNKHFGSPYTDTSGKKVYSAAKYDESAKTITYSPHGVTGIDTITLTFQSKFNTARKAKWDTQLREDGFTHIKQFIGVRVSISGTSADSIRGQKVWVRPFTYDKRSTPTILYIGKQPQNSIHYTIYKTIDLLSFKEDDTKYWNHGNVFTYTKGKTRWSTMSENKKNWIKSRKGIVLFGHGIYADISSPTKQQMYKDFYLNEEWWPVHVQNLVNHFHHEFLWSELNNMQKSNSIKGANSKIIDVMDLIPPYDPTYATHTSQIPIPQNVHWTKGDRSEMTGVWIGPHAYHDADHDNFLEIYNSIHKDLQHTVKVKQRLTNTNPPFDDVFIELDAARTKKTNHFLDALQISDMPVAMKTANDLTTTKQIIL